MDIPKTIEYDKNGAPVKSGNILFAITGSGAHNGVGFHSISFWIYPERPQGDTTGLRFSSEGELYRFWHCYTSSSRIMDETKIPESFMDELRSGLYWLEYPKSLGEPKTTEEIIKFWESKLTEVNV